MGISGTVGTITVTPTGGTIDGLATLALLPGQECRLRTDGTNWRSFGLKREVIIGTLDISTSSASGQVLLPAGYRFFEVMFKDYVPVVNRDGLSGQFSTDSGATWKTTNYYECGFFDNITTTTSTYTNSAVAYMTIIGLAASASWGAFSVFKISPGTSILNPNYLGMVTGYDTSSRQRPFYVTGMLAIQGPIVNALKFYAPSGNFSNISVMVKGYV
jgi:hypothetical protein